MVRRACVLVFSAVFLCAAPQGRETAHAAAPGPETSVLMLQRAIDGRDMALVEKHLDVDGVLKKGVDALVKDEAALKEIQRRPAAAVFLALGASAGGEALHALLEAEAREYVRHGIISGAFAGRPVEGASTYGGLFGKAFRGGGKDKKTFGPVKTAQVTRNSARLVTSLAQGGKNRSYPLTLVAEKRDGLWRIVEVANMAELIGLAKDKGER